MFKTKSNKFSGLLAVAVLAVLAVGIGA